MAPSGPGALSVFRDLIAALTSAAEKLFVFILRFACKIWRLLNSTGLEFSEGAQCLSCKYCANASAFLLTGTRFP